jgi:prepilin-type N-terminal cleavage/methylation domain-containing protein
MMTLIKNNKGFTLIEILVALSIDFVVLAGIYAAFYSQQKSHVKEQQVVDAQQNVRGAADFMTREIRLAGMERLTAGVAGILTAGPYSIQFTLDRDDIDGVAGPDENIKYQFAAGADIAPLDGIADTVASPITRILINVHPTDEQTIADNIYAFALAYAYDNDQDGELEFDDAAPFNNQLDPGEEIWAYDSPDLAAVGLDTNNATGLALPDVISFNRIRAVRIWILARTQNPLREAAVTRNYVVGSKVVPVNDSYQYRLLTATVKCRNLGI